MTLIRDLISFISFLIASGYAFDCEPALLDRSRSRVIRFAIVPPVSVDNRAEFVNCL